MCLAVPAKILSIDGKCALIDFGGVKKEVSISLVPDIKIGEFVLVHAGYAIEKFREDEALETLRMIKELSQLQDEQLNSVRRNDNA